MYTTGTMKKAKCTSMLEVASRTGAWLENPTLLCLFERGIGIEKGWSWIERS